LSLRPAETGWIFMAAERTRAAPLHNRYRRL
jgi:hypothetical protein